MVKSYININFGILEIFFNNARRILDGSRKFQGVQRGDFEGGKKKKKNSVMFYFSSSNFA